MAGAINSLPPEEIRRYEAEVLAEHDLPKLEGLLFRLSTLGLHSNPEQLNHLKERVLNEVVMRAIHAAPPSFSNRSANCWANGILQLIFNDPALLKRVLRSGNPNLAEVKKLVWETLIGLDNYERLKPLDSQVVRDYAIRAECDSVEPRADQHVDVDAPLQQILEDLGVEVTMSRYQQFDGDPERTGPMAPTFQPLLSLEMEGQGSFEERVQRIFRTEYDHPTIPGLRGGMTHSFVELPETLVIRANRSRFALVEQQYVPQKDMRPLKGVPPRLVFQGDQINQEDVREASYEIASVIIHLGESVQAGHYVTLLSKHDGYYLANDSKTYRWDALNEFWESLNPDEEITYERLPEGANEVVPGQLAYIELAPYEFDVDARVWKKVDAHNEELLRETPEQLMESGYVFNYRMRDVARIEEPERAPAPASEERSVTEAALRVAGRGIGLLASTLATPIAYAWGRVFHAKKKAE